MTVRTPLYYVSGNLREMDSDMINEIKSLAIYQYSLNPSVALSVAGSGGNLTSIKALTEPFLIIYNEID